MAQRSGQGLGMKGKSSGRGSQAAPSRFRLGGEDGKFTPYRIWLVLPLRGREWGKERRRGGEKKSMLRTKRTLVVQ